MAAITVWMLGSAHIKVSDGDSLSGLTQGDGSHLLKRTITLGGKAWQETRISDDDKTFDDNDGNQKLAETQIIDGEKVAGGTVVEAEYRLTLQDPETGKTYEVYGYNVNNSKTSYATVEGLAFRGGTAGFPPTGVPLQVIATAEGPGSGGQKAVGYGELAYPPCLTPGTRVRTPHGDSLAGGLRPGDLVDTLDHGPQPLIWTGSVTLPAARLAANPAFHPIRIRAGALGPGSPARDLVVSPQHRVLLRAGRAELLFGAPEVLVAAKHLVNGNNVQVERAHSPVTYIQLLFRSHQVIRTEGAETESFHPRAAVRGALPPPQAAEVLALFPALRQSPHAAGIAARPCLRGWEVPALYGCAPA